MDSGFSTAIKKLGTIGCSVKIMRAGVKLPHEITILERHEVGLDPLDEVSMLEVLDEQPEEVLEEVTVDVAGAEEVVTSVVQKIADLESQEEE
jgi:hypothetical protein